MTLLLNIIASNSDMTFITSLTISFMANLILLIISMVSFWMVYARHLITKSEAEHIVNEKILHCVKVSEFRRILAEESPYANEIKWLHQKIDHDGELNKILNDNIVKIQVEISRMNETLRILQKHYDDKN